MLSSVLEVLSSGTYRHKPLLGKNTGGKTPTVYAASVQANSMFVLLQSTVGIVAEQDSLGPIPETGPRPIVEKL